MCQPWVPAESTSMRSAHPASRTIFSSTACAVGLRQMLPMHTMSTRTGSAWGSCKRRARSDSKRVERIASHKKGQHRAGGTRLKARKKDGEKKETYAK